MSLLENIVPSSRDGRELHDDIFDELRAFVYQRTGIYFRDNKQYLLESQVGRRLKALDLNTFEDYLDLLRNGHAKDELPHLFNAVTINETSFFRHPKQYEAVIQTVLPELLEGQTGRPHVRLWSAACSTGDEPYTLALLIHDRLAPRFPDARFDIVGSDINTDVFDEARSGRYSAHAVRNVPASYLRSYFTQEGDTYTLHRKIRRMVTFYNLNLVDQDAMARLRPFDLIFCANVLIYFDETTKQQVVGDLYKALRPGGFLFVGTSETLHNVTRAFRPVRFDDAIGYKKLDSHA